jgi:hypothetical protein
MLHVVTWWWGDKYPAHYVERLRDGLRRHLRQPYRLLCMVDRLLERPALTGVGYRQILDHDLIAQQGCFARLRMFDRDWQFAREIAPEERIGCIDLDCVVTGPLDPLFDRPESFVILQGANAANPCPVNGSLMMLRGAAHQDVWSDFSLEAARQVPFHEFPDDQGWIAHKLPGCAGWQAGPESGVYAFKKPGWPKGDDLPKDARLVVFPGWRDPAKFEHLGWVKRNWAA